MFGLGVTEVLVILVVAFLLFGPQQWPEVGWQVGKAVKSLRDATEDVRKSVEPELTLMQAEMKSMEQHLESAMKEPAPPIMDTNRSGSTQALPEGVTEARSPIKK